MGNSIDPTIGEGVLKAKNANCERRVRHISYVFYRGIIDLPKTQLLAGISLVGRGTKCRH